jgi:hypothetical protein
MMQTTMRSFKMRRLGAGSRRSRTATWNTGRRKLSRMERLALLGSVKRNREQGWKNGRLGFPRGSRSGLAWGGDKRRLGLALARWLKREGKESRHLRALSLEKMTIVELLST